MLAACLQGFFPQTLPGLSQRVDLFLWVAFPPYLNTEQHLPRAVKEGVAFVPECFVLSLTSVLVQSMRLYCIETPERIHGKSAGCLCASKDRMALAYRAFLGGWHLSLLILNLNLLQSVK